MTNKKVIAYSFLSIIIMGFFINLSAGATVSQPPTKIDIRTIKGPISEEVFLAANRSQSHFSDNTQTDFLSPDTTILRNHDGTPSFYYTDDSTYFATRLTVPNFIASECTIIKIRYGLYRPRTSAATLCSLFVWSDTVIDDAHQPNHTRLSGLYFIPSWTVDYWAWNTFNLALPIVFKPDESFWMGFFCANQDINVLADGSENLDTCRNAVKEPGGDWTTTQYDFLQEAVVSYIPVDSNIGIVGIGNINRIVTGNTNVNMQVRVKNYGRSLIAAGVPVTLRITGPSSVYETTGHTGIWISPNGTAYIYFPYQFPETTGDYDICVWTNLTGDPIPGNDTMKFTTFVYTHGILETFLSPFPPAGWTVFNFNGDNQWGKATNIFYADSFSARILWDPVPYAPNNDWLITPRFKATPNDSLIFWYRAAASEFYETLLVRINTTSSSLDTMNFSVIIDTVVTNNTHWQHRIIAFNQVLIETANVFVAFHYPCYSNFYIAIDDIIMPLLDTTYCDFYPVSINTPKIPILADSSYIPSATIRNNSVSPETPGLFVFYEIIGNTIYYKESLWVGISGGNSENVEFPYFSPSVADTVLLKVWTSYPTDGNFSNDTIWRKVFIGPKFQTPSYTENFNEDWGPTGDNPPLGGWRIVQGGRDDIWNTNDWYKDTLRIGDSLRQVAKILYSPIENSLDRLISPRLNCSNPGIYNLGFWHWYRDYDPATPDSGVILISYDNGISWTERSVRYANLSDSGYKNFPLNNVSGNSAVRICFLYGAYNEYWWAIDDFSITWIPAAPVLMTPIDRYQTQFSNIYFSWQSIPNASAYEIQVAYDSLFEAIRIAETVATSFDSITLEPGNFWWRVRAGMPLGQWSEPRTFWILETGWLNHPNILSDPSGKNVKDGGAIIFCPLDSSIYALKGNNTRDFYAYRISEHAWQIKQDIAVESLKTRKVKKGSALCFGDSLIYAVKGNSNEFWTYNPTLNAWTQKRSIPGFVLKGGSGLVYVPETKNENKLINEKSASDPTDNKISFNNAKIYLLKGTSKTYEFYAYSISDDTWIVKKEVPNGPNNKPFKDGSALVYDGVSTIYALKGGAKFNEFYSYDINADTWSSFPGDTIPKKHPYLRKRNKVKQGGSLTISDDIIYAIKGGGSNEFWCYAESAGQRSWKPSDTIPRLDKRSVPKGGASLTSAFGYIYLLKGNNTNEFYAWIPEANKKFIGKCPHEQIVKTDNNSNINTSSIITQYDLMLEIKPNPCKEFTTISYSIPKPALVSIKLYDATGRVLQTIENDLIKAGRYNLKLPVIDLSPGVYFIGLNIDQKDLISKLIIQ
jgi:hypothetical protein